MPIINPTQLVDEFKKSGEFDRLRRELLSRFRSSDGMAPLTARVEDIAKQKLGSDPKLQYMPEAAAARELMQELDRYPIVERAVADIQLLSDPALASGIRESVKKILQEDRKDKSQSQDADKAIVPMTPSASVPQIMSVEPPGPATDTKTDYSTANSQNSAPLLEEKTRAVHFADPATAATKPTEEAQPIDDTITSTTGDADAS